MTFVRFGSFFPTQTNSPHIRVLTTHDTSQPYWILNDNRRQRSFFFFRRLFHCSHLYCLVFLFCCCPNSFYYVQCSFMFSVFLLLYVCLLFESPNGSETRNDGRKKIKRQPLNFLFFHYNSIVWCRSTLDSILYLSMNGSWFLMMLFPIAWPKMTWWNGKMDLYQFICWFVNFPRFLAPANHTRVCIVSSFSDVLKHLDHSLVRSPSFQFCNQIIFISLLPLVIFISIVRLWNDALPAEASELPLTADWSICYI